VRAAANVEHGLHERVAAGDEPSFGVRGAQQVDLDLLVGLGHGGGAGEDDEAQHQPRAAGLHDAWIRPGSGKVFA
jgi:hypothetical protein